MTISSYSTTPGSNTTINGINIAEGCPPGNINDAIRNQMADIATGPIVTALGTVGAPAYSFTGDLNTGLWSPAADTLAWSTGGSERARLDSSGNFGIGGTGAGRLDVITSSASASVTSYFRNNGTSGRQLLDIMSKTSGSADVTVRVSSQGDGPNGFIGTATNHDLVFAANNTERARFLATGDFLIGKTSANPASVGFEVLTTGRLNATISGSTLALMTRLASDGALLSFSRDGSTSVGSISITTTATAYNTSSDRRLKTNIAPASDAGAIIDALEVVSYDWKAGGHTPYGFIAQDLFVLVPEAVTPGDDDPDTIAEAWGRDDSKLVPLLVKEIQSLRQRLVAGGL